MIQLIFYSFKLIYFNDFHIYLSKGEGICLFQNKYFNTTTKCLDRAAKLSPKIKKLFVCNQIVQDFSCHFTMDNCIISLGGPN